MNDVSFYIDVWGKFYRHILSPGWIAGIKENCGCEFSRSAVVVNNIAEQNQAECNRLLHERMAHSIDYPLRVDIMVTNGVLANFPGLEAKDFWLASYQSLADLCAIATCETKYIVFFSGDSCPWGKSNWVSDGIKLLEENPAIMIVNPLWNGFYDFEKLAAVAENDECFLSHGFSDQCYLARTADLKAPIYGETNEDADRIFPRQHGNTFEKRVSAYMRNHRLFRASLKNCAYLTRP